MPRHSCCKVGSISHLIFIFEEYLYLFTRFTFLSLYVILTSVAGSQKQGLIRVCPPIPGVGRIPCGICLRGICHMSMSDMAVCLAAARK